jgi:hypothetical protein
MSTQVAFAPRPFLVTGDSITEAKISILNLSSFYLHTHLLESSMRKEEAFFFIEYIEPNLPDCTHGGVFRSPITSSYCAYLFFSIKCRGIYTYSEDIVLFFNYFSWSLKSLTYCQRWLPSTSASWPMPSPRHLSPSVLSHSPNLKIYASPQRAEAPSNKAGAEAGKHCTVDYPDAY